MGVCWLVVWLGLVYWCGGVCDLGGRGGWGGVVCIVCVG